MKHFIILFSFFSIFCANLKGQESTNSSKMKAVTVHASQTFKLNSVNYTFIAGNGNNNNKSFKIDLPPNTIEWYYSFATSPEDKSAKLNLYAQLAASLAGVSTGTGAITATAINAVIGTGNFCYVYLIDKNKRYPEFSKEKFKGGVVNVRNLNQDDLYLCFENKHSTNAVTITFEVVAIVEEGRDENHQKARTFGDLGWKAYEQGEYEKCLDLSKKALEYNPNLWYVHNNIGLVYLIKNDYISAIESYSTAISLVKNETNPKYWFGEFIKDLKNLIKTHGEIENSKEILDLLQKEYSKY